MADRIALIAHAGSRQGLVWARQAERLARERGVAAEVLLAEAPGQTRLLAASAATQGYRAVVGVGGDGTLGEVARGMLDTPDPPPLGILPAGTGNDTARALGVPLDLAGALERVLEGTPVSMDVTEVNGIRFLGLGVMGFAARVGEDVNRWKAGPLRPVARLFGQRAYHIASARTLLFPPRSLRARLSCPEWELEGIVFTILTGNCEGRRGVFLPFPGARADDGLLDVCVFLARTPRRDGTERRLSVAEKLRTAWRAVWGEHAEEPWVRSLRTAGPLSIRLTDAHPFVGDGDVLCRGAEFELRLVPSALRVLL